MSSPVSGGSGASATGSHTTGAWPGSSCRWAVKTGCRRRNGSPLARPLGLLVLDEAQHRQIEAELLE